MAKIPVALQLYSVREDCARDLEGTVRAVAEMGYEGVEFAGYHDRSAAELKDLCASLNLGIAGSHVGFDTVQGDALAETLTFNRALGNRYVVVPALAEEHRDSPAAWQQTASAFAEIAPTVEADGLRLGYHNHRHEFEDQDGQIPWDIFCSGTPESVVTQLDVGHCMRGGGDPVAYLHKYPGRAQLVHVKEYDPNDETTVVGEGVVEWEKVFAACESVGATEWYIVEHERYADPPMTCVEQCLTNLRKILPA